MFVETIAYIEAVHVGLMLPHYENTNVVDDEQYAEFVYDRIITEMLSPRGQSGLEAKILASASVSASKLWPRPRPWPQTFGLGLVSVCSRRTSSQEEID